MSLFTTIRNAGHSLEVFSTGIQVAGNNISNASTPGYIRERLNVSTNPPYYYGGVLLGTGSHVVGIRQQIDKYLEVRLHSASSEASGSDARNLIYKQLETTLGELGTGDLSTSVNDFLAKLNDVANQPENPANRYLAVQQGTQVANSIVALRNRVDDLRSAQTTKINDLITEANQLIDQVRELNPQITQLEGAGMNLSDAGGLRTQRYEALQRLSEILPIQMNEHDNGTVDVFIGSNYLVLGDQVNHLEPTVSVDRGIQVTNVQIENTHAPLTGTAGELNGVLNGRDEILGGFVDTLDTFTSHFIQLFNSIHTQGEGLQGFTDVTGTYAVDDVNQPLSNAGLAFPPQHGSFEVKVKNLQTGLIETQTINIDLDGIDPTNDTSLDDLKTLLNGVGNITATITADRKLKLTAADGYEISFANDTSNVLSGLGLNTFFTGTDSSNIAVNSVVSGNPNFFATGRGGGPADGSNAVELAQFFDQAQTGLGNLSLNQFYINTVSTVAQESASEQAISDGFATYRDSLSSQRAQYTGVSLDEEAINVMQLQRAYQATARMITTADELFNILLNI
ncbi:MAG: flagellar hook-associated protein FlgK [Planctomycetaceae bacterium]|nr:flagellar hook-associated protein FlgK [Planctomycetaceae bacterium]